MRWLPTTRGTRIRLVAILLLPVVAILAYTLWSPGSHITDGRHDRGSNGLWIAHGWLGDDAWFTDNDRLDQLAHYRDADAIAAAADRWRQDHITDLFPHLAPAHSGGKLPGIDAAQAERFFAATEGMRIMPWVGGVLEVHCAPDSSAWRKTFIAGVTDLLADYPQLAGIHLNIEPWPDGHARMLTLLDELRAAMPEGKLLSIAAYPPPTFWHPHPDVHWSEPYFREVARRSDQLAVMMYDTSIRFDKPYQQLMARWTRQVLDWSEGKPVLLGIPSYEDAGVGYHDPSVENLPNALRGIHAGLRSFDHLPGHYQGVAVYSDWTTDPDEWQFLHHEFLKQ